MPTFWFHYCILLDCGTRPEGDAIYKMIAAMESNDQIGGVCGHMGLAADGWNSAVGI